VTTPSQSGSAPASSPPLKRVARKVRLHPDVDQRAEYWAARAGFRSVNEFMALAIEEKIARMNGDYDLPSLEIQRLNQLLDEMRSISTGVGNLEQVVTNGFDSLLGLTRGDSYLQDADDGELDADGAGDEDGASDAGGFPGMPGVDRDVLADGFGGAL